MSEKTQKSIEKPWAVYGLITKFIGRVVGECKGDVDIRYSEDQQFSSQLWSSYAVERFTTSGEAIDYVLSVNHEYSRKQLTETLLDDFPKALKKEKIQTLHNLLVNYRRRDQSSVSSQRRAKCTKNLEKLERIEDFGSPSDLDYV